MERISVLSFGSICGWHNRFDNNATIFSRNEAGMLFLLIFIRLWITLLFILAPDSGFNSTALLITATTCSARKMYFEYSRVPFRLNQSSSSLPHWVIRPSSIKNSISGFSESNFVFASLIAACISSLLISFVIFWHDGFYGHGLHF